MNKSLVVFTLCAASCATLASARYGISIKKAYYWKKNQAAVRKSRRRLHGAGVKNAFRKL